MHGPRLTAYPERRSPMPDDDQGRGDREPWIKLKVGMRRSGKLAALPSDSARLGWFYTLLEAKVQRRTGTFDSRGHFGLVIGKYERYLDDYVRVGFAHIAPALCPDCQGRYGDIGAGTVVVHDFLAIQRDPTNADRQADYRARHGDARVTASVTPDVTASVTLQKRDSPKLLTRAQNDGDGDSDGERESPSPSNLSPSANGIEKRERVKVGAS